MAGNILHPFHFKLPQHGNSTVQKLPKFEVELAQSSGNNKAQLLEREVIVWAFGQFLFKPHWTCFALVITKQD